MRFGCQQCGVVRWEAQASTTQLSPPRDGHLEFYGKRCGVGTCETGRERDMGGAVSAQRSKGGVWRGIVQAFCLCQGFSGLVIGMF